MSTTPQTPHDIINWLVENEGSITKVIAVVEIDNEQGTVIHSEMDIATLWWQISNAALSIWQKIGGT